MPLPKKIPQGKSKRKWEGKIYVNRYKVVKRLGSGSFGTVFLVSDVRADNKMKVLKEIFVGEVNPDETVDAQREAHMLSKLDHPHIVKFMDSFPDGEHFCIVTEYCEGGDMDDMITAQKKSGKPFEETLLLSWIVQIVLALQYIHKMKILHRDLKTRNIFLKNNIIKLGDFGISRILMGTSDMATTFTGTPYYMSPEVLKHEGYNNKSDIWSLGVIIYEMCTFQKPFCGENLMGVMYKIVNSPTPDLPDFYSDKLTELYNSMLIKGAENRPKAADVLKSPYIAKHTEQMHGKLVQEKDLKKRAQEIAIACAPKKPHQEVFERPMTPSEKMRIRKQQEADEKAERLKQLTAAQYAENRARGVSLKMKSSHVSLPWVKDHPDVFSTKTYDIIEPKDSPSPPHSPVSIPDKNELRDSGHVEEEDSDYETLTLGAVTLDSTSTSDIPEDETLAETFYSQFEDEFEDDFSSGEESGDEYDALVNCMENALDIDEEDTLTEEPASIARPGMRQEKIKSLRSECVMKLGEEDFKRAYKYLKEKRFCEDLTTEDVIMNDLKAMVKNPRDCFLVDQLLFLEKQEEISASMT